jgi:hypothetical protein
MTAPLTKPVLEDQHCSETGVIREKNFLIKAQFAVLNYSIIEEIRRGDLNICLAPFPIMDIFKYWLENVNIKNEAILYSQDEPNCYRCCSTSD